MLDMEYVRTIVRLALAEDIGDEDITTKISVIEDRDILGKIVAREDLIVCGIPVLKEVFQQLDDRFLFDILINDSMRAAKNDVILTITGSAKTMLTAERTALNFIQRLSGIATLTAHYVKAIEGTEAVIMDTRKTTPLLRHLEKYAVLTGGGTNHRMGLSDQFLIKDNHIAVAALAFRSDIQKIVQRARTYKPRYKVEVEVDTLEQLDDALHAQPDIILLDNFSIPDLEKAVKKAKGKVFLEASGGITLDTVRKVAKTGVDGISTGALTHSVRSVDISLDIDLC